LSIDCDGETELLTEAGNGDPGRDRVSGRIVADSLFDEDLGGVFGGEIAETVALSPWLLRREDVRIFDADGDAAKDFFTEPGDAVDFRDCWDALG
jgi:hypothetical protein